MSFLTCVLMPVESIIRALATLPSGPGVYRMINAAGKDVYIGKAKNLVQRVSSYTKMHRLPHRLKQMVHQVDRVGIVTTASEIEALLLEAQLIKRYRPPYNILLKNGHPLTYLALSNHAFPRVQRHKTTDTSQSLWKIGPFLSRGPLQIMMDLMHKGFLLRSCSDVVFQQRSRPCLQYYIQRCSGPCVGKITPSAYADSVAAAKVFLKGKMHDVRKDLKEKMTQCVKNHAYDQAVVLRDQLHAIDHLMPSQTSAAAGKADVIGWAFSGGQACIHVMSWRDGATYGCETFFFDAFQAVDGPYILSQFLQQFYKDIGPPQRLILPCVPDQVDDFRLMARHLFQKTPHCIYPKRGPLEALLCQANQQARDALAHHGTSQAAYQGLMDQAAGLFSWRSIPQRIEIYDNSHHQGSSAVSVMVVGNGAVWDKKSYRTWSMNTGDDYAMMRQVMTRRFSNTRDPLPDFMVIDGGRGQLSVVMSVLKSLGRDSIPLITICKTIPHDTIFLADGTALDLPSHHPVLHWVQCLRDEAHRFAIETHRRKQRKRMTQSPIESLPGMGKKRYAAVMGHFNTVDALRAASLESLAAILPKALAQTLWTYLQGTA
jgi:excinuclease ABC subunit C